LAQLRRCDLILVDEVGSLPFSHLAAEVLFPFFSDRHDRASVGLTSNLDVAHWTEVFGHERMTAALLDRLVHRSTILLLEGESYRFRQSLQRQAEGGDRTTQDGRRPETRRGRRSSCGRRGGAMGRDAVVGPQKRHHPATPRGGERRAAGRRR